MSRCIVAALWLCNNQACVAGTACEDALVELLGPDTLCGVLQWSEQPHGSPWVHRQAMAFLTEEFSALVATPLLFQLTKGQLLAVLQSNFLQPRYALAVVMKPSLPLTRSVCPGGSWMSTAEPNIVSQTAHSVARRGARSRRDLLSDSELRDLLSELLCHVRTAHVLPPGAEALLSAQRRGLFPRPPPCMLGGEEAPPSRGATSWLAGPRPRLFTPYVEEAKLLVPKPGTRLASSTEDGPDVQEKPPKLCKRRILP
ncbi:hypothetical protein HPB50_008575 [Hyalomma asiaticum]|uniref:Uncharacterized protein n=1 Tax=Hyalomma asiaticum TaxID=266040 RepID=A0ACB7RXT0_HYAAI|nr:hypothetical protein HPB50_008575 [Hyalomma asiaticum]